MPLFFLIAIGAGAFTLGATAIDVTSRPQQPAYNAPPARTAVAPTASVAAPKASAGTPAYAVHPNGRRMTDLEKAAAAAK
jgi:hypothetical protein